MLNNIFNYLGKGSSSLNRKEIFILDRNIKYLTQKMRLTSESKLIVERKEIFMLYMLLVLGHCKGLKT